MIVQWNRDRVIEEGWTRFALRPGEVARPLCDLIPEIRVWADQEGRGEIMVFVTSYIRYATVALKDEADAVVFRMMFDGKIVNKTTRRRTGRRHT